MFDRSASVSSRSTQPLVVSLSIHVAFVFALVTVNFAVGTGVTPMRHTRVRLVTPEAPPMKRAIRTPPKAAAVHPQAALPSPSLPALAPPAVRSPSAIEAPPIIAETPPKLLPVIPVQPAVAKDVFTSVASASRSTPKPPVTVQTGGFSNASAAAGPAAQNTQVSAAGFGAAAVAPADAVRRPSLVAAAGFGDTGVASASGIARAAVRTSGFGDAVSAPSSASRARSSVQPAVTVAQILEKPRPAYTEEARRLQIEGEVQLEILFGASGEIQILRVVRGLGHGLDENAAQAARTIRFLPARKDGRPVDSTATVHIIFQLAS